MEKLIIKVCGMRDPENISGVVEALPDLIGFIFYPESKRFAGFGPSPQILDLIPDSILKVGVFVNENQERVLEISRDWNLDVVQLHGQESPDYCQQIRNFGITVFKAFSVGEQFDFETVKAYSGVCDYFLFDTKAQLPGGTGHKFNWQLLDKYQLDVPFFLSGGIGPEDVEAVRNFQHPMLFGIDINSGFEIGPALKDVKKVQEFIAAVRRVKDELL